MDMKKSKRFLLVLAAFYWALAVLIYLAASEQFHTEIVRTDMLAPTSIVGELTDGVTVTQRMTAPAEDIRTLELQGATYLRDNTGILRLSLTNGQGMEVARAAVDVSAIANGDITTIPLEQTAKTETGEILTLTLTTEGSAPGSGITVYYGDAVSVGRFDIAQTIQTEDLYTFNGAPGVGKLCVRLSGVRELSFYIVYWVIVFGIFAALALYTWHGFRDLGKGRFNAVIAVCSVYCRYQFLLKQLVQRDFKAKYKRSMLGMAWSFLNPLLTMSVQYVVFSTLFKSNTPNYPVYLLSGIVFFNFFSEAVSQGMTSITGNAALIKKVYMPKYIYPVSKVFSSLINFGLALIPLFFVMLITGLPFRPSMFLLVFDVLCMMAFIMGMIMLMSTAMTFFQDTQFLWSVISMIWMYMTPIFYPESIIPEKFLPIYHLNPMYQYITFARICIIDGQSPGPLGYLWCILPAVVVLALGILVFKKEQDKFVMYL